MLKRTIATVLALVMLIGLLPILPASTTALAANSGTCGENITWEFDDEGTLTITGYGAMTDYSTSSYPPWFEFSDEVKKVVFVNTGSGITSVGKNAFLACLYLTDVLLPPTLTTIGESAFEHCTSLPTISLPSGVTSIGDYAFINCKSLKEIVIPENVKTINCGTFIDCTSLQTVVLGAGVTKIYSYAFKNCTSLKNVYISAPLTMLSEAIISCPTSAVYHIGCSESDFTKKTTIYGGNDSFNNAQHLYNSYSVVLSPQGGTGGSFGSNGAPCVFSKAADTDFTISSEGSYIPIGEGLTFLGWNTKPDGSGTAYKPGDKYTGNAALNLYAQWEDSDSGAIAVSRLSGSTRNGTAVAISGELPRVSQSYQKVVLANGWDFADALAGGPLAYALDAPILLITGDENDEATFAEIKRLDTERVYILGGIAAVSESVETRLKDEGYSVIRIAGDNRFETATEIAEEMNTLYGGSGSSAFLAYSHNYPDALAVSGIAAKQHAPILYIGADGVLDPRTEGYLSMFDYVYILGGTGAISSAAEDNIKSAEVANVERIAGATRYETCLEINKTFPEIIDGNTICISTGANFPDALAGSVFAAYNSAPMMLVDPSEPLSEVYKDYILDKFGGKFGKVFIFGGKVAIPEAIENELRELSAEPNEP